MKAKILIALFMMAVIVGEVEGMEIKKGDSFSDDTLAGSGGKVVSRYSEKDGAVSYQTKAGTQTLVVYDHPTSKDKLLVLYERSGEGGYYTDWKATGYKQIDEKDLVSTSEGNYELRGGSGVRQSKGSVILNMVTLGETAVLDVKEFSSSASSSSPSNKKEKKLGSKEAITNFLIGKKVEEDTRGVTPTSKVKKADLTLSDGSANKKEGYFTDFTAGGLHLVANKDPDTFTSEADNYPTYSPPSSSSGGESSSVKYYYLADNRGGVRLIDEDSLKTIASWEADKNVKVGKIETIQTDKKSPIDEQLNKINAELKGGGMTSIITKEQVESADKVVGNGDYGDKPKISFGMNSVSVSKEKDGDDYLAYRAYNVNVGLDRTGMSTYGSNALATVQENYDPDTGKLQSKVITVYKADGTVDAKGTLGPKGELEDCTGDCNNPFFNKIQNRDAYSYWADALDRGAKWSQLSSLFGMSDDFASWRQSVDELFRETFILGGAETWAQQVCEVASDVKEENNALFSVNEDGMVSPTASIAATKQFMQSPSGNKWIYRLSFFVRNPEAVSPGNAKKYRSSTSAKSSKSLSGDERQIWNEIEGAGRDISNERARYSRTSKGKELGFNIEFSGQRSIMLLKKSKMVDSGDEVVFMGEDSFATVSSYNYNQVCLVFTDNPPKDAFYEETRSVCASIVDVTGSAPTQIAVPEKEEGGSSSNEFVVI